MQKLIATIWIVFMCITPVLVMGQEETESETTNLSEEPIRGEDAFAESIEIENGWLHYGVGGSVDGALLESWHDTDGDGELDVWFVYEADVVVEESYDTDGDGNPDLVVALDDEESMLELSGDSASRYERQDTARFTPEPIDIDYSGGEDLVGDLSDISIKEEDNGWIFFVLLFLVGGALYVFWQRQK